MAIEIDETIRAIFFRQVNPTTNWMAAINVRSDGRFIYTWRMRYRTDLTAPDDYQHATKSWWVGVCPQGETLEDVMERIDVMNRRLDSMCCGPLRVFLRGDKVLKDFMREFASQPWVKATEISKDEYEKLRSHP
jgi:hypothetical protein